MQLHSPFTFHNLCVLCVQANARKICGVSGTIVATCLRANRIRLTSNRRVMGGISFEFGCRLVVLMHWPPLPLKLPDLSNLAVLMLAGISLWYYASDLHKRCLHQHHILVCASRLLSRSVSMVFIIVTLQQTLPLVLYNWLSWFTAVRTFLFRTHAAGECSNSKACIYLTACFAVAHIIITSAQLSSCFFFFFLRSCFTQLRSLSTHSLFPWWSSAAYQYRRTFHLTGLSALSLELLWIRRA